MTPIRSRTGCTVSPAELTPSTHATNTLLTLRCLDSFCLANNPRTNANVDAGVNLGDLPDNRISGIVRGKKPMMEALLPLVTNIVAQPAL